LATRSRTPAQHEEVLALVAKHKGVVAAASRAEGIKLPTLRSRYEAALLWKANGSLPPERESFHSGRRLPQTADECWALLDDYIGRSVKTSALTRKCKQPANNKPSRIVIASDFHAPFQCNESVAEMIRRESGRADTLIINGDLMDFYSISRFIKHESVSMESELAATDALLGQLSAAFPEVVIVSGNHDHARFEKQLRTLLSLEMCHVIEYLTGGNMSVIRLMAKRYPNVRFGGLQVGRFGVDWLYQHGDIITAHAERFSIVPGSALRAIDAALTNAEDMLGLKPWKVLVQAHTHQMGQFPYKANRTLVEGGCMCQIHGYQLQAKFSGVVQRRGYVTLEQTNGVTRVNSIHYEWLDADRDRAA
jgi:predicted phosphodiesterase